MEFKPSAGEIANIWKYIIGNQAHLCFLEHWLHHAEDAELIALLKRSKMEAANIVMKGLELYKKAGFPPPIGFSLDKDVAPDTPRILSDKLIFFVLQVLAEYGVYGYGLTLGKIETPEVLAYFKNCLNNAADLYQEITEVIWKKGYQHQAVHIPVPQKVEMIENKSFLNGWWGEQRPLTAIEIDNLILSLRGVILAKTMYIMLLQISKDAKVQKFCKKGKELCGKRVERFQSLNTAENIPFQATYESEINNSTASPFSDRLIMFEAMSLAEIAIIRYGNALSSVTRHDLSSMLGAYIVETGAFLNNGLKLLIEKQWVEQPPMAAAK
jgi:hypothetical protein